MKRTSENRLIRAGIGGFVVVVFVVVLLLVPSGRGLVVVPWQMSLPSATPLDNPVNVVVSGPDNTSFKLTVSQGNATAVRGPLVFEKGFTLPPNKTSPQSFLPVEVPATNLTLGTYTVDISVGGIDVVNGTFRVVEAYNLTTIYENVTELKQTVVFLETQVQNEGFQIATLQNAYDTAGGAIVGAVILMLIVEPIRVVGTKSKRRFAAWVHRLFGKREFVTRSALLDEDDKLPTPDLERIWHTTCCALGHTTFYTIDGAKLHYSGRHQTENPVVGVDIVLDEAVVWRIRERNLEPIGIPADYGKEALGDYYVFFDDLGGL